MCSNSRWAVSLSVRMTENKTTVDDVIIANCCVIFGILAKKLFKFFSKFKQLLKIIFVFI